MRVLYTIKLCISSSVWGKNTVQYAYQVQRLPNRRYKSLLDTRALAVGSNGPFRRLHFELGILFKILSFMKISTEIEGKQDAKEKS